MKSNNKLYIVTVATEDKYYYQYLKESCIKNGIDLITLGYGQKWQGFAWKLELILNFLKNINAHDIVCFIDGYDVICIRKLEELINVFKNITLREKCKIIVSKDCNNNSTEIDKITKNIIFGECKNTNLNSGTYIGYAYNLTDIIGNAYKEVNDPTADDQILLTKYCNIRPNDFYIDINNEVFAVVCKMFQQIDDLFIIDNNKIIYNNSQPFFIHAPGFTFLDKLLIKIGYSDSNNKNLIKINDDLQKNSSNKMFNTLIHFAKEYLEFIILIVLCIIFIFIIIKRRNVL